MSSAPKLSVRPPSSAHIKGAALREFLRWYRTRAGDDRVRAIVAAMPAAARAEVEPSAEAFGVLAAKWYPATAIHALCDAVIADLAPAQRAALARDGARVLMDATLRGLYRAIFEKLVSPAMIVRFAPTLWRTYFDDGDRSTESVSDARHDGIVARWGGHHPFLCAVQVYGTNALYEAAGCKNVVTTPIECVSSGAERCRWSTTWQRS